MVLLGRAGTPASSRFYREAIAAFDWILLLSPGDRAAGLTPSRVGGISLGTSGLWIIGQQAEIL